MFGFPGVPASICCLSFCHCPITQGESWACLLCVLWSKQQLWPSVRSPTSLSPDWTNPVPSASHYTLYAPAPMTILVALSRTCCSLSQSFLFWWATNWRQYSKWSHTITKRKGIIISLKLLATLMCNTAQYGHTADPCSSCCPPGP